MKYGSRKFLIALLALISAHWALIERLIEAGDYKAVMLGIVAVYMCGNVGERVAEAKKDAG